MADKTTTDVAVDIGFLEAPLHPWSLWSSYFPSKAGGRPAWLNLRDLPSEDQLTCPYCERPMVFCCQVYSPLEHTPDQFHRTIYVFLCTDTNCHTRGSECIRVFRNQLPCQNEFYDSSPPPEVPVTTLEQRDNQRFGHLCAVCGCRGPSKCSQCSVHYCSRDHQMFDWKYMGHKVTCGGKSADWGSNQSMIDKTILPEFELVVEEEELGKGKDLLNQDDEGELDDEIRMDEYRKAAETLNKQRAKDGDVNMEDDEVPIDEDDVKKDVIFLNFQKRIKKNPDQVIRHVRDSPEGAVWVSEEGRPSESDIPPCQICGGNRMLEFQILPQILYFLKLDLDWGVLGVFTCENSCSVKLPTPTGDKGYSAYTQEVIWRQMHSNIAAYELPKLESMQGQAGPLENDIEADD